jgi:hypothetical protein
LRLPAFALFRYGGQAARDSSGGLSQCGAVHVPPKGGERSNTAHQVFDVAVEFNVDSRLLNPADFDEAVNASKNSHSTSSSPFRRSVMALHLLVPAFTLSGGPSLARAGTGARPYKRIDPVLPTDALRALVGKRHRRAARFGGQAA